MSMYGLTAIFWWVLAGCSLAFALLWWRLRGVGRIARQYMIGAHIRRWERTHQSPSPATVRVLKQAVPTARRVAQTQGDCMIFHDKPWLLFMGGLRADLPALLSAVQPAGPVAASADDGSDTFWRWWLTRQLVAIEVCPPSVAPDSPEDGIWFHALRELARQRPQRPLDGIVLCVSVYALQAEAAVARSAFGMLCQRVHDAASHLRLQLPVYLVVTGLQRLPGYASVHASLPPAALDRVLGCLPDHDAQGQATDAFDTALSQFLLRFQALRLGLLREVDDPMAHAEIHAFVEAVLALAPGLSMHIDQLIQTIRGVVAAPWQGVYLTATGSQGAFVVELFQHLLPFARGLARDKRNAG